MQSGLSLRLRIFLFFCLIAAGSVLITGGALAWGYLRADTPALRDPFIFSGILAVFGLLALVAGIWLLFDENVARPIERLSAQMRARAHAGVQGALDVEAARHLGDLGPAAAGLAGQLSQTTLSAAEAVAEETARLSEERTRLTALLTELPIALVLAGPDHRIVLYDGQAADILAQFGQPRLGGSLFDYFDAQALETAYARMVASGADEICILAGGDGMRTVSARMKPLRDAPGYILILEHEAADVAPDAARPLVYDFALLEMSENARLADRPLAGLCFAVFDTETTGLLPHKDDIVQIGAVRVLNGRIVEGEAFDMLVDPGRPIPPASTRVHGVTDAMVSGAPGIGEAGRLFHDYCRDSVIVAHNAPFDMAFLRRHEQQMDVRWHHPIVDTVLLSAVVFGAGETHTLDALCDRLDVTLPAAMRHTAIGDARATAEALVRMLPILEAHGMRTLEDVLAETRKHGRLLQDLN